MLQPKRQLNADRFASKRYRHTELFTVMFTGKSGNVILAELAVTSFY